MELARGYGAKNKIKIKHLNGVVGLDSDTLLVIKLPDSRLLRILARSVLLAMFIVTLPFIGPIIRGPSSSSSYVDDFGNASENLIDLEFVHLLVQDLADQGLIIKSDIKKALVVSSGIVCMVNHLHFLNDNNEINVIMESDLERQRSIPDETFDFAFIPSSFQNAKFVNRVVKIGGIVTFLFSNNNPSFAFPQQSNYEIMSYLGRFSSTIVAMRKSGLVNSSTKRRLCAKKAASNGLEDAMLEPPKQALVKSNKCLKKFKYIPDLLGDSLEDYPRRIFINVSLTEENRASSMEWFDQNYPRKNQGFEIYYLEMAMEEEWQGKIGISDWLMKNVREDEYVVMKAEAEFVEEMMKGKSICLVDELFLECKNEWTYRECLALYGRIRDEGVAVHQWWGWG